MLEKAKISAVQLTFLLFMADFGTSFILVPTITSSMAGPDAWLSISVIATIYGTIITFILLALASRFPSRSLNDYLPDVMGTIPGKVLSFIFAAVLLHMTSVMVSEAVDFIHTAFLLDTPPLAIEIVGMTIVTYGVYLGIEVIARENELIIPAFIFCIIVVLVLALKDFNISNLQPVMENGIKPILKGGMVPAAWRGEIFIILFLFPFLNQKKFAVKSTLSAVILIGVANTVITVLATGIFGYPLVSVLTYSFYEIARYVSVFDIFQRLEMLVVFIWMAGATLKLAIFLYTTCTAAASTFNLKTFKTAIIPVTILAMVIHELYYNTYLRQSSYLIKVWPYEALIIELVLPTLILLVALLRKKEDKPDANSQ